MVMPFWPALPARQPDLTGFVHIGIAPSGGLRQIWMGGTTIVGGNGDATLLCTGPCIKHYVAPLFLRARGVCARVEMLVKDARFGHPTGSNALNPLLAEKGTVVPLPKGAKPTSLCSRNDCYERFFAARRRSPRVGGDGRGLEGTAAVGIG